MRSEYSFSRRATTSPAHRRVVDRIIRFQTRAFRQTQRSRLSIDTIAKAKALSRQLRRSKVQHEARSPSDCAGRGMILAEPRASKNPIVARQARTRHFDELHGLRDGRNARAKPVWVVTLRPCDERKDGARRILRIACADWIGPARLHGSNRRVIAKKRRGGAALWVDVHGYSPPLKRLIRQGRRKRSSKVVHYLITPYGCTRDWQCIYIVVAAHRLVAARALIHKMFIVSVRLKVESAPAPPTVVLG